MLQQSKELQPAARRSKVRTELLACHSGLFLGFLQVLRKILELCSWEKSVCGLLSYLSKAGCSHSRGIMVRGVRRGSCFKGTSCGTC